MFERRSIVFDRKMIETSAQNEIFFQAHYKLWRGILSTDLSKGNLRSSYCNIVVISIFVRIFTNSLGTADLISRGPKEAILLADYREIG